MSDRSTRVFGPASMPTLDNPTARPGLGICKPPGGYWWQDVIDPRLLQDDAGSVAHITWDGSKLVDKFGNAWAMQGTVPQVQRNGVIPPGAGPFSDVNYYSLGAGSDILDFAGDFSLCIVYAGPLGSGSVLFSDGLYGSSGYYIQHYQTANGVRISHNTNPVVDYVPPNTGINVVAAGRIGSTAYLKCNRRAMVSGATGALAPGTGYTARIGRYETTGYAVPNTIYELLFTTTPPSDALFTAWMDRVKSKLGITAW